MNVYIRASCIPGRKGLGGSECGPLVLLVLDKQDEEFRTQHNTYLFQACVGLMLSEVNLWLLLQDTRIKTNKMTLVKICCTQIMNIIAACFVEMLSLSSLHIFQLSKENYYLPYKKKNDYNFCFQITQTF